MNPQSNQHPHHPTYRSPFLSPLTPPAAGNGGGGGFGRNHHSSLLSFTSSNNNNNATNATTNVHPYSPSSFRVGRTPRLYNIDETPTSVAADATDATSAPEWNTQQVHVDLQTAGNILLQRQLKCSAKFIAELDIGLVHDNIAQSEHNDNENDDHDYDVPVHDVEYQSSTISEELYLPSSSNNNNSKGNKNSTTKIQYPSLFQYARTLVELGDYAYAATTLSVPTSRTTTTSSGSKLTPTPSSSSSSFLQLFFRCCAGRKAELPFA